MRYALAVLAVLGGIGLGPCGLADGATVSTITQSQMPANVAAVHFEGLKLGSNTAPYTEASAAFDTPNHLLSTTHLISPTSLSVFLGNVSSPSIIYITFGLPVTSLGWTEQGFQTFTSATLYSDQAGTQSMGTFDITIGVQSSSSRFHGFSSDMSFSRVSLQVPSGASFSLDDVTFNVPEPSGGATLLAVVLLGGAISIAYPRRARR